MRGPWTMYAWWVEIFVGLIALLVYGPFRTALAAAVFAGLWHACRHPPAYAWANRLRRDPRRAARLTGGVAHVGLTLTALAADKLERRHIRRVWKAALRIFRRPRARIVRKGLTRTPAGWVLHVRFPFASTAGSLSRYGPRIASAFRAREVRVFAVTDDAREGVVEIICRDPLAAAIGAFPAPAGNVWRPVNLGVDEDGHAVQIVLPEHNALIGGQPGGGKTVILHQLIAAAATDPNCRLTILDGKAVDLQPWATRCDHYVGANLTDAISALEAAKRWLDWSNASLRDSERVKVEPGDAVHLLVVDELGYFSVGQKRSDRFNVLLRDLIARGRAGGLVVTLATQKPSAEVVPTSIRDLVAYRIALRCTTPEASDTVLGQGWATHGADASKIAQGSPGLGYVFAETDRPRRFRAYDASPRDVRVVASHCPPPEPPPTAEPTGAAGGVGATPTGYLAPGGRPSRYAPTGARGREQRQRPRQRQRRGHPQRGDRGGAARR